jgi:hypothetical protein
MASKKLIVVFSMLFSAVTAFAQTEADFTVTLTTDGKGAIITGYTGRATAVKIPVTIQGMPVQEIGSWIFSQGRSAVNNTITSVVIPKGVTVIGTQAFMYAKNLNSVTIPESVTEIRKEAFYGTALNAVVLPKTLKILESGAFAYTNISTVTLPQGVKIIESKYYDDDGAFQGCAKLKTVIIPEGVTEIHNGMFGLCTSLTSITLPASVTKIGLWAFSGCSELVSVTIPASVTSISFDDAVFGGCPKLNLASQALLKKLGYKGNF